ncbi:MAG: VIT1/CCC1 transporter family protein [Methanobacteriota archaeon]
MRKHFIRGMVDGSLSTLGIVIGASAAILPIILAAALGGMMANSISNALSAFSSERVFQFSELRKTERSMVRKSLKGSVPEHKKRRATAKASLADGSATIVGGLIPILPYLLVPIATAMFISTGLVIATIFVIGMYIGKLSKENILFSALKMAVFGIAVVIIAYLVQAAIVT